jgi:hypothetical protein
VYQTKFPGSFYSFFSFFFCNLSSGIHLYYRGSESSQEQALIVDRGTAAFPLYLCHLATDTFSHGNLILISLLDQVRHYL